MYQQIILIGNLGEKPEMRYTPSGVPVREFSLAVNKRWTNQDGESQEKTTWFRVVTWRKQAETVAEYLDKGSQVMVTGEMEEVEVFQGRDGNPRANLKVTALNVKFLGGREGAYATSVPESGGHRGRNTPPVQRDADIPF